MRLTGLNPDSKRHLEEYFQEVTPFSGEIRDAPPMQTDP